MLFTVQEMMTRPTMLAQLGSLLMNARGWQNNRCKDVVMISPPNAEKMCLVLAVMAQTSQSERVGNPFGASFRAAAEDIEAQVHVDGFDQSAMLVRLTF